MNLLNSNSYNLEEGQACIHKLIDDFPTLKQAAGQVIVPVNDLIDSLYIIQSGIATISTTLLDGACQVYALMGAEDLYGIAALTRQEIPLAELAALTAVEYKRMPIHYAWEAIEKSPSILVYLLECQAEKIRSIAAMLDSRNLSPSQRLLYVINAVANKASESTPTVKLTTVQLSNLTGLARETVSRSLPLLVSKGLISREGSKIVIQVTPIRS